MRKILSVPVLIKDNVYRRVQVNVSTGHSIWILMVDNKMKSIPGKIQNDKFIPNCEEDKKNN